jgi:hypothetical protein
MREALTTLVRRLSVALLISIAPIAAAQAADDVSPASLATSVAPGRYVWRDDGQAAGPVRVLVSLPLQLAFVWRGKTLVGISSVSSGAAGYDTPTGTFSILEKDKDHHSNIYDDAPMPWMLRLTWDGVALHAGKVTGEPASHGCVRLPAAFAKRLFDITDLGATVTVIDDVPDFMQQEPGVETAAVEQNVETPSP